MLPYLTNNILEYDINLATVAVDNSPKDEQMKTEDDKYLGKLKCSFPQIVFICRYKWFSVCLGESWRSF